VKKLDYLVDLHTASFGHLNTYYIRADLTHKLTGTLAEIMRADIVLHNAGEDGTLRAAAVAHGIPTICCEMGDPHVLDSKIIRRTYVGLFKLMIYFKMVEPYDEWKQENELYEKLFPPSIKCMKSYWIYTEMGGILTLGPKLKEQIKKGDHIASVTDVFGFLVARYKAPEDGIVIGKTQNPSNHQGDRILHLGIIGDPTTKDQHRPVPEEGRE